MTNKFPENAPAEAFAQYLAASEIIDANHPEIRDFAADQCGRKTADIEKAVTLYYAVRDGLRYDPYSIDMTNHGLSASRTLASGRGWCVSKAVLLAAACRAQQIPARVGFADVKNHLSTEKLRESMGTDIFYWHGYTAIYLNDAWVKATPAFNIELCEKFRIKPLEFDGQEDSIYHPFDLDGRAHMEYVNFRGEFADVPVSEMKADFDRYYPNMSTNTQRSNFDQEVDLETR